MASSLLALINASLNNYDDTDTDWRNFVLDYKNYLISNSTLRTISNSYLQGVRFNIKAYLRSINYSTNCAWIIQLINNIPNDVGFTSSVSFLYIPPFAIIEQLYTLYITVKGNS